MFSKYFDLHIRPPNLGPMRSWNKTTHWYLGTNNPTIRRNKMQKNFWWIMNKSVIKYSKNTCLLHLAHFIFLSDFQLLHCLKFHLSYWAVQVLNHHVQQILCLKSLWPTRGGIADQKNNPVKVGYFLWSMDKN